MKKLTIREIMKIKMGRLKTKSPKVVQSKKVYNRKKIKEGNDDQRQRW